VNRIISQPFELELHTWFEEFASRVARSPFAEEDWVQNGLNSLARLKEQVAQSFRLGSLDAESTHKSLACSAAQLLEEVVAEEGPTAASWLNRPILKLQSYLAGGPLDPTIPGLLREARKNLASGHLASPVLTELLLWSESHKTLSGLELKAKVELLIAQANADGTERELSLEELLTLSDGDEDYYEEFLSQLDAWEQSFVEFEQQVESSLPSELHLLDETASAFDDLSEKLEVGSDSEDLKESLEKLQDSWKTACSEILPLLSMKAAESGQQSYTHLDSFSALAAAYQSGYADQNKFAAEVGAHRQRWQQSVGSLRAQWLQSPTKLKLVDSIELSLKTLEQVTSPGDARLGPMLSVYVGSLRALIKMEG